MTFEAQDGGFIDNAIDAEAPGKPIRIDAFGQAKAHYQRFMRRFPRRQTLFFN